MPNHYHFLVYFGNKHANFRMNINMENLSRKVGTLQSSYTRAINHQEGRVGSLFQAKFKVVEIVDLQQAVNCLNYIHRNPLKAGPVNNLTLWTHSSFNEYYSLQDGVCDRELAYKKLKVPRDGNALIEWMDCVDKGSAGGQEFF